jgi:hypothetical protein
VFEQKVEQRPLRIVSNKEFETNYEVVLWVYWNILKILLKGFL